MTPVTMAHPSPIAPLIERAQAPTLAYGPPELAIDLVEQFAEIELEYAAIRKGCVLLDQPNRSVLISSGPDHRVFLNNMLTQELKDQPPLTLRRSFWLNRKGRIEADLRVIAMPDGTTLLEVDALRADHARTTLDAFLIAEDAAISHDPGRFHRLGLHGPTAPNLLQLALDEAPAPTTPPEALAPDSAAIVRICGHDCTVFREDWMGEVGLELIVPALAAREIYERLISLGAAHEPQAHPLDRDTDHPSHEIRMRPAGWFACNIARIEAGTPLYPIDFGPDNLPHESGVLADRVSFRKGCYLGQEVVARMQSLGHPKQRLVALRPHGDNARDESQNFRQPVGGAHVFALGDGGGNPVGSITSSTISPMLAGEIACFAMLRYAQSEPGTRLCVAAEGAYVDAVVQPSLRFWSGQS